MEVGGPVEVELDEGLGDVGDRGEPAAGVAVHRGVADGGLALVAGDQEQGVVEVGDRPDQHPPDPAWMFCKGMSWRGLDHSRGSPVIDSTTSVGGVRAGWILPSKKVAPKLLGDGPGGVAGLLARVLGREVGAEEMRSATSRSKVLGVEVPGRP